MFDAESLEDLNSWSSSGIHHASVHPSIYICIHVEAAYMAWLLYAALRLQTACAKGERVEHDLALAVMQPYLPPQLWVEAITKMHLSSGGRRDPQFSMELCQHHVEHVG